MAYPEVEALVGLVGRAHALEILLEARVFGAEEALAKGLVTRVLPDEEVADAAYKTAERIASGAPLVRPPAGSEICHSPAPKAADAAQAERLVVCGGGR